MAKTAKERDEERKAEKLAAMQEQIEAGSLTVRKMTDAERKRYAPRPQTEKARGRGGARKK
jgi:hypothetical protein